MRIFLLVYNSGLSHMGSIPKVLGTTRRPPSFSYNETAPDTVGTTDAFTLVT